jgi:DNA-binding CsgD family transcriptional regulator
MLPAGAKYWEGHLNTRTIQLPALSEPGGLTAHFSHLLLNLYQLAMSSNIGGFEDQLFLLLQEHVSFDAGWLGKSTETEHGTQMHNSYLYNLQEDFIADWEQIKNHDPIAMKMRYESKQAVAVTLADEHLTGAFRKFMGKHAVAQVCSGISEDPVLKILTHLSLYKNSLLPAILAQEVELMGLAIPHIAAALNLNRVHHLQQIKTQKSNPRASFAICDKMGVLHYADASFAGLMLLEWPTWDGAILPSTFRKLQQEKKTQAYGGKLISMEAEQVADLMLISAMPRSSIDALTTRELAVVRLYGQGLTYKTVAKQMQISPATVRHHLRQAYVKLGIQSKGEIAWLLRGEQLN